MGRLYTYLTGQAVGFTPMLPFGFAAQNIRPLGPYSYYKTPGEGEYA